MEIDIEKIMDEYDLQRKKWAKPEDGIKISGNYFEIDSKKLDSHTLYFLTLGSGGDATHMALHKNGEDRIHLYELIPNEKKA